MKNIPLFLTIGLLVLIVGGYFGYTKFFSSKPLKTWDLIPEQTVLVYEVGDCIDCFDKAKNATPSLIYNSIAFPFNQKDSVSKLFDFLGMPIKGQLISLHVTSKNDFDFIFYTPGSSLITNERFSNLKESSGVKYSEREFNGNRIQEIKFGKHIFSWVALEDLVVASFTPFLVEDVIRTYTSEEKSTFLNQVSEVYQLPRIKNDAGNVYVHLNNFISWLGLFSENPSRDVFSFGQASLLDVKQDDKSLTLNGFSLARKNANSMLSLLEGQTPVQYSLKQYISERTLVSENFGISDGALLYKKLPIATNNSVRDTLRGLVQGNIEELYASLGPEMSVNYLEGRGGKQSKVFIFQSHNVEGWLNYFDKLSNAVEKEDTVFYEQYSSYEIREIELYNLPDKLFHPLVSGFSVTYYSWIGNTIIIADDLEILKTFLQDIDHEEVWGKSISFNRFLESTLLESSFSIYINTPLVWNSLSKSLSNRWKEYVKSNDNVLRSLDMGAVQFSYLNESFYTNITWKYGDIRNVSSKKSPSGLTKQIVTNFESSIINGPFIIRNHASKQDEIIVQDSLYNVYQVSQEGKILWKVSLEGPIVGDIDQVDFFKNGKLQIFFATDKRLHIIDRLGNYVKPFPITVPTQRIEHARLVDYDNSKKYRFLVTDVNGKLWMYDKDGENLEGWRPRSIEGSLISAAKHYRIRGKDFIVAIRKDGWAHVFNRRGEDLKGFPLNLDARPDGDFYLETGNSLITSYFVCVSRDGFRVKFNLEGKIISKETLIKPTFETKFSLVREQNGKSYLIKRQDVSRLSLMDENLKEIISNDFVGTNQVEISFHDFGSGKIFISITDKVQNLSYLYNGSGKLISTIPIESTGISIRPENSNQSRVITVYDAALNIQRIDN